MKNKIKIRKPEINDSGEIREFLSQWTGQEEFNIYVERKKKEKKEKPELILKF